MQAYKQCSFLIIFLSFFSTNINAQTNTNQVDPDALGYYTDALRFSQTLPAGSTRFQGLGGAGTSLGGDLGNIVGNPAGLGYYTKSEMSFSLGMNFAKTKTTFQNNITPNGHENLNLGNMGMVFTSEKNDSVSGWKGGSFGIGLTRTNNFQNQFSYTGKNSSNSMTDYFVELATGTPAVDLDNQNPADPNGGIVDLSALAYWTYLIEPVMCGGQHCAPNYPYYSYLTGQTVRQDELVNTKGNQSEWNFAYGGNFDDKIYFGFSMNIPTIRYISNKTFKETPEDNSVLNNFRFTDYLKITGTGINFKGGMIYRLNEAVRLGLTLQSPTFYGLKSQFQYKINASFNNYQYSSGFVLNNISQQTLLGNFNYNLTTPARVRGGVSFFKGKSGFFTADVEYVPYNTARLSTKKTDFNSDISTFTGDNNTINNIFRSTFNFYAGTEWRKDILRFRAGASYLSDPIKNIDDVNRSIINFSAGFGIRQDTYFFDVALVNTRYNSLYKPYTLSNHTEPEARVANRNTNFIVSLGTFF